MKPKLYIAGTLLVAVLGLVLTQGDSDGLARRLPTLIPERGVVTFVEGVVERQVEPGRWEAIYVGDRILPDDTLRTQADGRTEVSWGTPRRVVRVERSTVLKLSSQVKGDRALWSGFSLETGAVWAKIQDSRTPFRVSTPDMSGELERATAALRVDEHGDRLTVYQGRAVVGNVAVNGGEGLSASPTGLHRFVVGPEDDLRDGWRDLVHEVARKAAEQPEPATLESTRLTKDLRDLNPEVYLGVEVELTGYASEDRFQAEAARVRKIKVKSDTWDGMRPDTKVQLLNETFSVLRHRYPGILETVVLEFDDNRPQLSLKYARTG